MGKEEDQIFELFGENPSFLPAKNKKKQKSVRHENQLTVYTEEEEEEQTEKAKKKHKKKKLNENGVGLERETENAIENENKKHGEEETEKAKKKKKKKQKQKQHENGIEVEKEAENGIENGLKAKKESKNQTEDDIKNDMMSVSVSGEGSEDLKYKALESFEEVGLPSDLLQCCRNFEKPSPIQAHAWPFLLNGRDFIGIAATGSDSIRLKMVTAVPDHLKKNRKKTKIEGKKDGSNPALNCKRIDKPKEKRSYEETANSASKMEKKMKKQKIETVDNDAEMSKLNGEELVEQGRNLDLEKKKKSKKQKAASVDNDMEMSKLNGEELVEEGRDLDLKKKKKSKKQKVASVDNDMEMEKLEAEKSHEEKSLSSNKKMKSKNKKSVAVDESVRENTKGAPLKGMKKWLLDYHGKRPGLHVLMQEIDEFIVDHEARVEKERKERDAAAAAEGWTVVVHQKGRKKTVDAESGIAVGSVAEAAAKAKSAKKKSKETDVAFYRFQMREARRNEILELQKRFVEDKKRIAQMRAARKFRPY